MTKKLGNLKIKQEQIIDNEELIRLKGGLYQCNCVFMNGWFTVLYLQDAWLACHGTPPNCVGYA